MAKAPVLRKETVTTASLGEVVVRMLKLSERLALGRGSDDADAFNDLFPARLLAAAVADKAGAALYTVDEWDIFAAENPGDAKQLLDVARRLSGMDGAAQKKD